MHRAALRLAINARKEGSPRRALGQRRLAACLFFDPSSALCFAYARTLCADCTYMIWFNARRRTSLTRAPRVKAASSVLRTSRKKSLECESANELLAWPDSPLGCSEWVGRSCRCAARPPAQKQLLLFKR
ncbi:hypothetical protein IE81DRAFT_144884 [Ceraceosorus guamensis]|uniref:Uncharacterized protein n=1 Tax=Ceraceosorus guamensis TaxID=1522189 RepID=A0A316VYN7_9BASI|nr:hypothetical protein IE81DRAFT_144884 [Ceraceosorus guamensis]PWN42018.1 hypothetical protein IE81DRAFT_144884 [Ceraceosorus guamensis]